MEDLKCLPELKQRGYNIGKLVGQGCFSKIFAAEYKDKKTGETLQLACKWINKNQSTREFKEKFVQREIKAIIQTSNKHPFIIELHSVLDCTCSFYVFMRWAERGDLLTYLKKYKKFKEPRVNLWAYQIASAFQYLHGIGYVHRDLKLENIFLTKNLNIRIGDFGFARYCEDGGDVLNTTFCGTESYAAPEIVNQVPYDPMKTDIWSFGVCVFTLLYGFKPFIVKAHALLYLEQSKRSYTIRQDRKLKLSAECLQFIHDTLEPDPNKRPDIFTVCQMDWLNKRMVPVG